MGTKSHKLFAPIALATAMAIWGSACVESDELVSPVIAPEYSGCISATALDTGRIEIRFEFPSNASRVRIYRDGGLVVGTFAQRDVTSHVDIGLEEGLTYTYSCEAMINGIATMGARSVEAATVSVSPPTFGGITSVSQASARSARLRWNPGTGVPTSYYQVYFAPTRQGNPALAMTSVNLVATFPVGTNEMTINGLGDELTYAFGVRACTEKNICDTNTRFLTLALPDAGAPQTAGAAQARVSNGEILLTAPWSHGHGAIFKRVIYRNTTGGTNLAAYGAPFQEVFVTEPSEPPTTIRTGNLSENQTYYFIIQDFDVAGAGNDNLTVVSATTSGLSKPIFTGLDSLANPTDPSRNPETTLEASWTAIGSENGTPPDPEGASQYLLYMRSAAELADLKNACTDSNTPLKTLNAADYGVGSTVTEILTGLAPKTYYSVCVKAIDKDGNISNNTANFIARTLDKTPPTFDGAQSLSYDFVAKRFEVSWHNPPVGSDIAFYKAKVWRVAGETGTRQDYPVKTLSPAALYPGLYRFGSGDFPFQDKDTVFVLINACDEADNCTSIPEDRAKSQTLPDLTPPKNFTGIKTVNSPSEGTAIVNWNTPAPETWADFAGFIVYHVALPGDTLTELKRCFCPGYDCLSAFSADSFTSCTLTGLSPYRQYHLHMRAFDASGNIAVDLDPTLFYQSVRIMDQTPPTFSPTLSVTYQSGAIKLSWNAATDLQATGQLYYKVYRKAGTNFTNAANPTAEGTLLTASAITATQYSDSSGLAEFTNYYYVVCALDESGNTTCDSTGRFIKTPDISPPSFSLTSVTNVSSPTGPYLEETLLGTNKSWTFNWTMSDNNVAVGAIQVMVYRTIADDRTTFPDPSATAPYKVLSGLASPASLVESVTSSPLFHDSLKYANYALIASDGANKSSPVYASILIDNRSPPAPAILSHAYDEIMQTVVQTFSGSCKTSGATTTAQAIRGSRILSVSCADDNLTLKVAFLPNEPYPEFSLTTTATNGNAATLTFRVNNTFRCPTNYVAVEANPSVGADKDFCVAKFEMKAVEEHPEQYPATLLADSGGGRGRGNGNFPFVANYYPGSRPDGTPWVNANLIQASTVCSYLTLVEGTYSLISGPQWQAIAREIMGVTSNWSGNAVATTGRVNRGHSDNVMSGTAIADGLAFTGSSALAASSGSVSFSDSNPYVGTGQTNADAWNGGSYVAGDEQKRTHTLLTGEVIWDFSGNVAELVSTVLTDYNPAVVEIPDPNTNREFTNTTYFNATLDILNRLYFGPAPATPTNYSSTQMIGTVKGYSTTKGAIVRGGSWADLNNAGIFRTALDVSPSTQAASTGFRCVYVPRDP